MDIGLTAKLKPEIDDRQVDRQASKLEDNLQDAIEDLDFELIDSSVFDRAEDVQDQLEDFDMGLLEEVSEDSFAMDVIGAGGPASANANAQAEGGGGGGILGEVIVGEVVGDMIDNLGSLLPGQATTMASSRIGNKLASISANLGTMGTALLGGAALVGITGLALFALKGILNTLAQHSPLLESVMSMLGLAVSLFFRPFGNILGKALLPVAKGILQLAARFNTVFGDEGLTSALIFLGSEIVDGFAKALWMTTIWLGEWIVGGIEDNIPDLSLGEIGRALRQGIKNALSGFKVGGLPFISARAISAGNALGRLEDLLPAGKKLTSLSNFLARQKPRSLFNAGLRSAGRFLKNWGKAFVKDIPLIGNQLSFFGRKLNKLGSFLGGFGKGGVVGDLKKALAQYSNVLRKKGGAFFDDLVKKGQTAVDDLFKGLKKRLPKTVGNALEELGKKIGKILPSGAKGTAKQLGRRALGPAAQAAFFIPEAMRKSEGGFTGEEAGGLLGGLGGSIAGFGAGAKAGGVAGAALGSVVPGAGTAVGGAVGAGVGGIAGAIAGENVGRKIGRAIGGSIPEIEWSEYIPEFDIPEVEWGDYLPDISWPSIVSGVTWSSIIDGFSWSDFVPGFAWASFLNNLSWSSFLNNLNWGDWLKNLTWSSFVPEIPWNSLVPDVPWERLVPDVPWGRLVPDVPWSRLVPDVPWDSIIPGYEWRTFIDNVDLGSYVTGFSWSTYIDPVDLSNFVDGVDIPGGGNGGDGLLSAVKPKEMASGGIVQSATPAIVGEGRESEAVLPLSRLQSFVDMPGQGVGASADSITVDMSLDGSTGVDEQRIGRAVGNAVGSQLQDIDDGIQRLVRQMRRGDRSGPIEITADGKKIAEVTEDGLDRYQRSSEITR